MRKAHIFRQTKETAIDIDIDLDGSGVYQIETPVGFLNHMIESFSKHSFINIKLKAEGDIDVSYHHLVEDVGIVLGQAVSKALGDRSGINRYGFAILPMDEALVLCSLDFSGRGLFYYDRKDLRGKITEFDFELIWEFIKGFALESRATVHIKILDGHILHHIAECSIKSLAFSVRQAVAKQDKGILSMKGLL